MFYLKKVNFFWQKRSLLYNVDAFCILYLLQKKVLKYISGDIKPIDSMTQYEFMFIVDPSLREEENTELMKEIKDTLSTHGVTITNEDVWWTKRLAYRINKSAVGFYALFDLEMDGKIIKKLSKDLNLQKSIWRYIFVKKES